MKSRICNHNFLKIEHTTFQWCRYCGNIRYDYEVNGKLYITFFKPKELRDIDHKQHDWFKLSEANHWCIYCGTMLVIRLTNSRSTKIGYLKPYISVACKNIRQKANL